MKYFLDPSKYDNSSQTPYPNLTYAEAHFFLLNRYLPTVERVSPSLIPETPGGAAEGTKTYFFPFEEFISRLEQMFSEYKLLSYATDNGIPSSMIIMELETDFLIQITLNYQAEEKDDRGNKKLVSKPVYEMISVPAKERVYGIEHISFVYSLSNSEYRKRIIELEQILYSLRQDIYPAPVSQISIICKTSDGVYYTADRDFYEQDAKYRNYALDLHYGDGFKEKYHDPLMNRLRTNSNGIVLLHGTPGTGKTFYIRRLVKELFKVPGKKVVIVPNTFVKEIATPEFFNFLYEYIQDNSVGLVLVIEDAENILRKRSSRNSFESISNILNMTDGLLNDFVHIQIIATFNTELENIDSAILRHKRLLARKEFHRLKKERACRLAEELGIPKDRISRMNAESYSLAEIYSLTDTETDELLLNSLITGE